MRRLDLNLLQVLDTVLSEGSVAKAARRLHVTPSAVSNSLARLRPELGDPLVIHRGHGVVPTPRAAALAPHLKQALQDLERTVRSATFDPATSTRCFTLAMSDVPQIARLPLIAEQLAREMPHAQLRVIGIDTYLSWGGIASTEVDAAIVGVHRQMSGIHVAPLYVEATMLVARRANRASRRPLTRQQLAGLQHIEVRIAPGRDAAGLAAAYARAGIAREVVAVVPSFVAAAALVAASDRVATLPESLVAALGGPLGLVVVRAAVPRVTSEIKLVWHERTSKDPAASAFREVIMRALGSARPGSPKSAR